MNLNNLNILNNVYINKSLCSECKGKCCKTYAGIIYPDQIGDSEESIRIKLIPMLNDEWSIDWWEGPLIEEDKFNSDERYYFVRPKHVGASTIDPSWGGQCSFLREDGCQLSIEERPIQCLALEPKDDFNCREKDGFSKKDGAMAWIPYQDLLGEMVKLYS